MNVTQYLDWVVGEYKALYPKRQDVESLLCRATFHSEREGEFLDDTGICYQVALLACAVCPEIKRVWVFMPYNCKRGDGYDDLPVHCVLYYNGQYFDTTDRNGVSCLSDLTWFKGDTQDFVEPDDDYHQFGESYFSRGKLGDFITDLAAQLCLTSKELQDSTNYPTIHC